MTPLPEMGANEPPATVVQRIFTNDARAVAFTFSTVVASALTCGVSRVEGRVGVVCVLVTGGACTIALAGGGFCVGSATALVEIVFLVEVAATLPAGMVETAGGFCTTTIV